MAANQGLFYQSLRAMHELTTHELLVDLAPAQTNHNKRASILRHGLVVCSFSSLESYLNERIEDVCQTFANVGFPYTSFSENLQKFLVVEGIIGLANAINFRPKPDRLAFADRNLRRISTFDSQNPIYTSFGFSPRGSNVGAGDITNAIVAFGISEPWRTLSRFASTFGGGTPNLQIDFENMSRARNSSAHDPSTNVPTADVQSHLLSAINVAVSFDAMIGRISAALATSTTFAAYAATVQTAQPRIRFVDERLDGNWDERSQSNGRSLKIHANEAGATLTARQRQNVDLVVVRDTQSRPLAAHN